MTSIILCPCDIGFLHVLDYYLHLATKELATYGTSWSYWHACPCRYRDIDGDTYA